MGNLKIQLQPLGQAQAWYGQARGVIWECFFHETRRKEPHWEDELFEFWGAVEQNIMSLPLRETTPTS